MKDVPVVDPEIFIQVGLPNYRFTVGDLKKIKPKNRKVRDKLFTSWQFTSSMLTCIWVLTIGEVWGINDICNKGNS